MFAIGIAFLALFSAISILLGNEDSRRDLNPRDELARWTLFGVR
jgi:hypothetical protein